MTAQVYGKYKITDSTDGGSMVWLKAKSKRNALVQFARKYYRVCEPNLFIGRPDLTTYTLHRYRRGKIEAEPFAKVIIN